MAGHLKREPPPSSSSYYKGSSARIESGCGQSIAALGSGVLLSWAPRIFFALKAQDLTRGLWPRCVGVMPVWVWGVRVTTTARFSYAAEGSARHDCECAEEAGESGASTKSVRSGETALRGWAIDSWNSAPRRALDMLYSYMCAMRERGARGGGRCHSERRRVRRSERMHGCIDVYK